MRRSAFMHVVVLLAMVWVSVLSTFAGDRVRATSTPSSEEHLLAARFAAVAHVAAPRSKNAGERVLIGTSPCDCPSDHALQVPAASSAVHTPSLIVLRLHGKAPSAGRAPPRS